MTSTKQTPYLAPMVKAVAFIVENGFVVSPIQSADSDNDGIEVMQEYTGPNSYMDGSYF